MRNEVGYKLYVADPRELERMFQESGALLEGHFLLSSGLHSARYLQCALVLEDPVRAERLGRLLAERFAGQQLDVVVSPALGALIIGHEVARAAGARFLFTERDGAGKAALRRGFRMIPGERTLVVEDVVTTGGSTREVIALLREAHAEIRGVAAIVDRSGGQAGFDVPLVSLVEINAPTFPADQCEMCRRGDPIEKPGSKKQL